MEIIELISQELKKPLPGRLAQEQMLGRVLPMPLEVPKNARIGAVLCLLFPRNNDLNVLFMKRQEDRTAHSGQVSFPGGKYEETDRSVLTTALREANEEVGIASENVQVLGALSPLYIPVSNFNVFPFVGFSPRQPEYTLSNEEVSYVLEVPLTDLFQQERKTIAEVVSPAEPGIIRKVNAYRLDDGTVIWGATAMILSELEWILKRLNYLI